MTHPGIVTTKLKLELPRHLKERLLLFRYFLKRREQGKVFIKGWDQPDYSQVVSRGTSGEKEKQLYGECTVNLFRLDTETG